MTGSSVRPSDANAPRGPKILLVRILGNDLHGLHGRDQTLENLRFTLQNEAQFEGVDKLYLLNRIHEESARARLRELLVEHGAEFVSLDFPAERFARLPVLKKRHFRPRWARRLHRRLYPYNLIAVNNNGARNSAIQIGRDRGYEWTLPLDSNAFFTAKQFHSVEEAIANETGVHYVIIPQLRLADHGLENVATLDPNFPAGDLLTREPQIGVHREARLIFNRDIPYGCAPKAELLRALGVHGPWSQWPDNWTFHRIRDRTLAGPSAVTVSASSVTRLVPGHDGNRFEDNGLLRLRGVFELARAIQASQGDRHGDPS